MRPSIHLAVALALTCLASSARAAETRCGWYVNPSPGTLWLLDRDGRWSLTSMMISVGPDAADIRKAPRMGGPDFVAFEDGVRGYNCACLTIETNRREMRVTRVLGGRLVPTATCRRDARLPPPEQD